jgi:hypothetical protein
VFFGRNKHRQKASPAQLSCPAAPLRPPLFGLENSSHSLALFSFRKFCKIFQDSRLHRIFGRMYKALNIDKK